MQSEKIIIFTGHFDVGEKVTDELIKLNKSALEYISNNGGDLAILIGDIGATEKFATYVKGGLGELVNLYLERINNCKSICIENQLPKKEKILNVIDENQYKKMWKTVLETDSTLTKLLKTIDISKFKEDIKYKEAYEKLNNMMIKTIIPKLVKDRMKIYRINKIKIYSERQLRNLVTKRTRNPKKKIEKKLSWKNYPNFSMDGKAIYLSKSKNNISKIVSDDGVPLCRGILLALYEKVSMEGYNRATEFYLEKHKRSLDLAKTLYLLVAKKLPSFENKKLKFNFQSD